MKDLQSLEIHDGAVFVLNSQTFYQVVRHITSEKRSKLILEIRANYHIISIAFPGVLPPTQTQITHLTYILTS